MKLWANLEVWYCFLSGDTIYTNLIYFNSKNLTYLNIIRNLYSINNETKLGYKWGYCKKPYESRKCKKSGRMNTDWHHTDDVKTAKLGVSFFNCRVRQDGFRFLFNRRVWQDGSNIVGVRSIRVRLTRLLTFSRLKRFSVGT